MRILPIILFLVLVKGEATMKRVPAVAGAFYPRDRTELSRVVDGLLAQAPEETIPGRILGAMVPHAGYSYSGGVAARVYKAIAGMELETVVLVGPSHQAYFKGVAVYARGSWQTPLGEVEVDEELAEELLAQNPDIRELPEVHRREHSLEVQLPFLQRTFKGFKILPVMMGDQSLKTCQVLAEGLVRVCRGRRLLLLASSDLYHGGSYKECVATDARTLGFVERYDPEGLAEALVRSDAQACGGGPVVAVMLAARGLGANRADVLYNTNSDDITGERGGYVVGYGAAVFYAAD